MNGRISKQDRVSLFLRAQQGITLVETLAAAAIGVVLIALVWQIDRLGYKQSYFISASSQVQQGVRQSWIWLVEDLMVASQVTTDGTNLAISLTANGLERRVVYALAESTLVRTLTHTDGTLLSRHTVGQNVTAFTSGFDPSTGLVSYAITTESGTSKPMQLDGQIRLRGASPS